MEMQVFVDKEEAAHHEAELGRLLLSYCLILFIKCNNLHL
jgi:hypothetical protein